MALYSSNNICDETKIWVWKVEESFEYLYDNVSLTEESEFRLQGMKSHAHQKAFLAVRMLLQEAGYTDYDMYYEADGKPYLLDDKYISITHSFEFVSILVSEKPCGVDIEKQRDKVIRIADKFVHPTKEIVTARDTDQRVEKLTVIWAIKEAAYKLLGLPSVSFKQDIHVKEFDVNDRLVHVSITLQGETRVFKGVFYGVESFVLAYIIA